MIDFIHKRAFKIILPTTPLFIDEEIVWWICSAGWWNLGVGDGDRAVTAVATEGPRAGFADYVLWVDPVFHLFI